MELMLNGQARSLPDDLSVARLLELEGLAGKRVAVERNGAIVPRAEHARVSLRSGDRVEIVAAVGGG